MDEKERSSQSLFGNDVRHSVGTVKERWEREKTRRRSLMMRTVLPLALIALAAWLIPAAIFKFFPFNHYQTYEEYMAAMSASMKKDDALERGGNPEAKLKVKFIVPDQMGAPATLKANFRDMTDTHPSDLFIETWNQASVSEEERKLVKREDELAIVVNGKTQFKIQGKDGKEIAFSTVWPAPEEPDMEKVVAVLNQEFRLSTGIQEDLIELAPYLPPPVEKPKNELPSIVTETNPNPEARNADGSKAVQVDPSEPEPIVLPAFRADVNKR